MAATEPIATKGLMAWQSVSNFVSVWLKVYLLTQREGRGLHIGYFLNFIKKA